MKRLFCIFAMFFLFGCMEDYDTFGTSDYRNFEGISFKEQDGSASVYVNEHKMIVTLKSLNDSINTLDSVTILSLDISSLSSLHLVESKFKEFSSDTVTLDSLAKEVAYSKKKLKAGSKIRLPESKTVYVVIVSESGKPSIWQWTFKVSSLKVNTSDSVEDTPKDSLVTDSTANVLLSKDTGLSFKFKDQVRLDTLHDTLFVKLLPGALIENAELESWSISKNAIILPSPDSVNLWQSEQKFEVTAEDGTNATWILILSESSSMELLYIAAKNEAESAKIDADNKTVVLTLQSKDALSGVVIDSILLPNGTTSDLPLELDLTNPLTFKIMSNDEFSVWTISAVIEEAYPQLKSITVGKEIVEGVINEDEGTVFFNMNYDSDLRLDSLQVNTFTLLEGAFANIIAGTFYDLAKGIEITVSNASNKTKTYTLQAGYQYLSSSITQDDWVADDNGNKYDLLGFDNGNNSFTKTLATSTENGEVLQMTTTKYMGKIASGNTFTAYFNPKSVSAITMLSYEDGNELIDFGRPFYARPKFVEFDAKYEGKGDSCDMYVLLESRMTSSGNIRLENDGMNRYRSSGDVNTLVASAWFRATSITDNSNPDVVSITEAAKSGFYTVRLRLQYGIPKEGSPLYDSRVLSLDLKNSNGIDNHLESTTTPSDFKVTHIRIVMASSANGNTYTGIEGATLYVDALRFIY